MSGLEFFSAQDGLNRGDAEAILACQETAVLFCELLDAGDADAAFSLHHDELAFFPPGAQEPVDKSAAIAMGKGILAGYPGRRTLHLLGNFLAKRMDDTTVRAQYVISVYELTREVDGQAQERDVPALFAFAHEQAVFRRGADGCWRYLEQRMVPIAPLNPFAKEAP